MPDDDGELGTTWPRLTCNRPNVVDEEFDGEAVLVHLGTGVYFSLEPAGTAVWRHIVAGHPPEDAESIVIAAYGCSSDQAIAVIADFVARMAEADLLVVDGQLPQFPSDDSGDRPSIQIEAFTDLQDVLLVDPIHDLDLDGDGWPVAMGTGTGRPVDR